MVGGRQGSGSKNLGVSLMQLQKKTLQFAVVKTTLDRIKKLDSDLQKSYREEIALILGIHSCPELLKAKDLRCHYRQTTRVYCTLVALFVLASNLCNKHGTPAELMVQKNCLVMGC